MERASVQGEREDVRDESTVAAVHPSWPEAQREAGTGGKINAGSAA